MKKVLVLFLVVLFLGCGEVEVKDTRVRVSYSKEWASTPVYKFDFENHNYICFDNGKGKTIVHNPDCSNQKCEK